MAIDDNMAEAPAAAVNPNNFGDDEDDLDDTPLFVGEGDAVEVAVDDTVPMDDDDDDMNDPEEDQPSAPVVDMARFVLGAHKDAVYAVASAITTDGRLCLVSGGGDDKAYWHDIALAQQQPQQPIVPITTPLESHYAFQDSVSAVASNYPFIGFDTTKPPNDAWMATGGLDGSIVLFRREMNGANGGAAVKTQTLEGPSSDIEWLCWHPKGGNVLLAGSSDATIWMYHTTLKKCLQVFVGHEDAVTCGSFSADGKVALSASADGTVRIWGPKVGKCKHVFRFADPKAGPPPALTCMAIQQQSLEGSTGDAAQLIMVGSEDGQAHVCHVANKRHVTSLRHFDPTQHTNTSSTMGGEDEEEEVFLPSGVEAVGFCQSNPNWCATGGMDGVLKIWDLSNQGCRHSCRVHTPNPATTSSPPDTSLTPEQPQTQAAPRGDGITQLQWHPTLPLVITSTCRGQVHLWDARNGQLLQTLTGHTDVINDMNVSFVPPVAPSVAGHAIIVTASDDKTVRIFDLDMDAAILQQQQQ